MSELQFGEDAPLLHVMSTMRAMRRLKPDPVPRDGGDGIGLAD